MDRAGHEGRPHLRLASRWTGWWPAIGDRSRTALIVAAIAVLDWPVRTIDPAAENGIDGSWQMVVHLWGRSLPGLGPHIEFTYGPLGFITVPTLWFGVTCVIAFVVVLATIAMSALVAVTALRRWLPLWAAAVVALLVVRGVMLLDGAVAVWPLLALWWAADHDPVDDRARIRAAVGLALIADVLLMCKFGDGIVMAGVVLAIPLLWTARPWRELCAVAATLVVGSFALWSILTLAPGQYVHYVRTSLALAGGYWSMTLPGNPGATYLLIAVALAVAVLVLAAVTADRRRAVVLAVVCAWVLWLELKHAFVRADRDHIPTFFVAASVLALVATTRALKRSQLPRVVVAAVAVTAGVMAAGILKDIFVDPTSGPWRLAHQVASIATPGGQRKVMDDAKASIRARYQVSSAVIEPIANGTVEVDPFDTEVAWAYGLRLRTVPVFQLYSAYTTSLDHDNVRAIDASGAADYVLRHLTSGAIDGRVGDWESPAYQLAVLCHYEEVTNDGQWQLLRRTPTSMCGIPTKLETASLRQRVFVPAAPPGTILVATFDVPPTPGERLRRLVFREAPPIVEIGAHRYPFLSGAGDAMHLLQVPPGAPVGPAGAVPVHMRSLRVHGSASKGTVTFWAVPYGPALGASAP